MRNVEMKIYEYLYYGHVMSEDRTQLRKYLIKASHMDRGAIFCGDIVIEAYDREEAIAQFKERRWELSERCQPRNIFPMGRECQEVTCEPYKENK